LFADDTVCDDKGCKRSNVVDNEQQNCVSTAIIPTHVLLLQDVPKNGPFLKFITPKCDDAEDVQYVKMFISLSGVRMVF